MTTTHHLEYLPDRAAMESMRLMLLPMKGSVDGPSAREPFDHLMESTPAAPGVAYEATSIGGVPGWWCLLGGSRDRGSRPVSHFKIPGSTWSKGLAERKYLGIFFTAVVSARHFPISVLLRPRPIRDVPENRSEDFLQRTPSTRSPSWAR